MGDGGEGGGGGEGWGKARGTFFEPMISWCPSGESLFLHSS